MNTDIMKGFDIIDIDKTSTASVMTITQTKIRFNKATAQELSYPMYAIMSLNPNTRQVAIQGSGEGIKNAFLFAKDGNETRYSITVDIMALANCVRKLMKWTGDNEYTTQGQYFAAADAIIYDLDTAVRGDKKTRKRRKAEDAPQSES